MDGYPLPHSWGGLMICLIITSSCMNALRDWNRYSPPPPPLLPNHGVLPITWILCLGQKVGTLYLVYWLPLAGNYKKHPLSPGFLVKSSWDYAPKCPHPSIENWNTHGAPPGGGALSIIRERVCAALETPFFISPKSFPRYYFHASLPLFWFYCLLSAP